MVVVFAEDEDSLADIVTMGAGESSLLAVEERGACFKRGPDLTEDLYLRHCQGEEVPGLLTQVIAHSCAVQDFHNLDNHEVGGKETPM